MEVKIRSIRSDELQLITEVLNHIPEFDSIFYTVKLKSKLMKADSIILVAEFAGKPVGCKVGYNRYYDGSIYSWLGGVLLPYRNQGIATSLQREFETIANRKFFNKIRMKTRNKHVSMFRFSLKNGFIVSDFVSNPDPYEARIELIKQLGK